MNRLSNKYPSSFIGFVQYNSLVGEIFLMMLRLQPSTMRKAILSVGSFSVTGGYQDAKEALSW